MMGVVIKSGLGVAFKDAAIALGKDFKVPSSAVKSAKGKVDIKMKKVRNVRKRVQQLRKDFLSLQVAAFYYYFRTSLRENDLNLEPLTALTVAEKREKGYKRPDSPLYGLAEDGDGRAYIDIFKHKKIKGGYEVYVNESKLHHDRKIKLYDLFMLHEYGGDIPTANGSVRIPPRPAMSLIYDKVMSMFPASMFYAGFQGIILGDASYANSIKRRAKRYIRMARIKI